MESLETWRALLWNTRDTGELSVGWLMCFQAEGIAFGKMLRQQEPGMTEDL